MFPTCPRVIVLCALLLAVLSAQATRAADDSLSAPARDTCRWFDWSSNGRLAHDGRLLLQSDGTEGFGSAFVTPQYTVGDVLASTTPVGWLRPINDAAMPAKPAPATNSGSGRPRTPARSLMAISPASAPDSAIDRIIGARGAKPV
jgi:hypothetical protein